jgi:hypothetical protein
MLLLKGMIPLLVGVVCLLAVLRLGGSIRPGLRARWPVLAVVVLTFLMLLSAGPSVDHYRFSLLGLRHRVVEPQRGLIPTPLVLGGDAITADVHIPGVGKSVVARLAVVGDSMVDSVLVEPVLDAPAAVVVYHPRGFGRGTEPRVLGGRALGGADRIRVHGAAEVRDLRVRSLPGGRLNPLAGGARHAVVDVGTGHQVPLPGPADAGAYQRTYPLVDVLARLDSTLVAAGPLGSFFYYLDGQLHFADLDSEVELSGGVPLSGLVWSREGGGRRLLVAGLAHRDFPEPDLELPERYGIRPLRSGRIQVAGSWLDFYYASPEVRTFGRRDLEELTLPETPEAEGAAKDTSSSYAVRLSPESDKYARRAVTFAVPPERVAAQAQAIFRVPRDPDAGSFGILAPSGTAEAWSGRPFALDDGRRGLVLRVDGQSLSAGWWLLLAVLFGAPTALLVLRRMPPYTFAVALTTLGFASLRLLMGLSAHLEFPFSQESLQIGLWVVPLLPWAVVLAGEDDRGTQAGDVLHMAYAGLVLMLTWSLFSDSSLAKQAMLAAVPIGLWVLFRRPGLLPRRPRTLLGLAAAGAVLWTAWARMETAPPAVWVALLALLMGSGVVLLRRLRGGGRSTRSGSPGAPSAAVRVPEVFPEPTPAAPGRIGRWRRAALAATPGLVAGLALVVIRTVMDVAGWEESINLGSTRLALSILYTPASLFLMALAMVRHGQHLKQVAASKPGRYGRALILAVGDLLGFVFLAYGATALVVSDIGLALTNMPAPLVILAVWLTAWAAPRGGTRGALALVALPLTVFALAQAAPELLNPPAEAQGAEEVRLQRWSNNRLRLVERGDPEVLRLIGQRRSEALGIMSETMRSYTRGNWWGNGFVHGEVSPELRSTATQEHVASALLAGQWGLMGVSGVLMLLASILGPLGTALLMRHRGTFTAIRWAAFGAGALWVVALLPSPVDAVLVGGALLAAVLRAAYLLWGAGAAPAELGRLQADALSLPLLVAGLFLATLTCCGVYMVLANYGVVFFTGKNIYLLGLDSVGDVFESLVLLCGATWALREFHAPPSPTPASP